MYSISSVSFRALRLRKPITTFCLVLVALASASNTAKADFTTSIAVDTPTAFTLVLQNTTGIDASMRHVLQPASGPGVNVSPSGYWLFTGSIDEFATDGSLSSPNDTVSFRGTIQHLLSPPGHNDGAGPTFSITFGGNADEATGSPLFLSKALPPQVFDHGSNNHKDTLTGSITASVVNPGFDPRDDITSYTITLEVRHTAVPEPGSLTLLGLGGLSLIGHRWRRRGNCGQHAG